MIAGLRRYWIALVPTKSRRWLRPMVAFVVLIILKWTSRRRGAIRPGNLVISGFVDQALGHSSAFRYIYDSLQRVGLSPEVHDIHSDLRAPELFNRPLPGEVKTGVWIVCCNAPEAVLLLSKIQPACWRNRYRIGYWAFELPRAPKDWVQASKYFDEIWVPSKFVAQSLKGLSCPVRVMPFDVATSLERKDRQFSAERRGCKILCAGDTRSSLTRKNLKDALDIYMQAFPHPVRDVQLILKLNKSEDHSHQVSGLRAVAEQRADIVFIEEKLTREALIRLLSEIDVFLSPHRSEGYGLLIAETLALLKPALATGWSGNLDFMHDLPELLLPYSLVPVEDSSGVYEQGCDQMWAQPDIQASALKLRELADSEDKRRDLGVAGRRKLTASAVCWRQERLSKMPFWTILR